MGLGERERDRAGAIISENRERDGQKEKEKGRRLKDLISSIDCIASLFCLLYNYPSAKKKKNTQLLATLFRR